MLRSIRDMCVRELGPYLALHLCHQLVRRRTEVEQVLCLPQDALDIQRLLLHREQCQRDDLLRGEAASLALIDC
jgi:hypothetical protein